jgi:hypothetical protein
MEQIKETRAEPPFGAAVRGHCLAWVPRGSGRSARLGLTQRGRTLQHVTASPAKIGLIARAALVLVLFEHKMIT